MIQIVFVNLLILDQLLAERAAIPLEAVLGVLSEIVTELLERLDGHLEDLVEAHVAEAAGDLAVLRERARVLRAVHLVDELVQQLQPEPSYPALPRLVQMGLCLLRWPLQD